MAEHQDTTPATEDLPELTNQEAKARHPEPIPIVWNGHKTRIHLKQHTWALEKGAMLDMAEQGGVELTRWIEYLLENGIDHHAQEKEGLTLRGVHRQGLEPGLVWTIAREADWIQRYGQLGFRIPTKSMAEDLVREMVDQVLDLERRLRKAGFSREELAYMDATQVRRLYQQELDERDEEAERQAQALAKVLGTRLGV